MAEVLKLKSKAIKVYDYRNTDITGYIPEFTPDEEQLQKDLDRILRAHGERVTADIAEEGNMIVMDLESENERFNKKGVMVPLGKGIYSKELEAQIKGKKVGEEFTATVDGKEVKGVITRSTRTVLPELTDENVAAFGMEGVSTVKDLKALCVDKQIANLLDESEDADQASAAVWQALSDNSEIELDPDELKRADEAADIKVAELEAQKPVFETEEEKETFLREYEEEYGIPYEDVDFGSFVYGMFHTELNLAVMGYEQAVKEGRALTEDDYQEYLGRIQEAYPDMSKEQIEADHTREEFIKQEYNNIICDELDEYVAAAFKKKMNPYR